MRQVDRVFLLFLLFLIFFFQFAFTQTDSVPATHKSSFKKWLSTLTDTTGGEPNKVENIALYEDHVYMKNIKTVQLYDSSFQLSSPIIQLGSKQQIKLSFDDLEGGLKTFNYTLIHCSSDWTPSDLQVAEYINGFPTDEITDHSTSLNTLQVYTHYNLVFPGDLMTITKSGNYVIEVYRDNNPNKLVLTRRFVVVDQKVTIDASIKPATVVMDRNYKQQINFTIDHSNYTIDNPFGDLKVIILQNGRLDNAISTLKPSFIKDGVLTYNYDEENVFTGGNEFRNFDLKTLHTQTEHVQKITIDSSKNIVYLMPDEQRTFKRYAYTQDINGRYLIKVQEASNSEREADYVYVHFFIPYEIITDGSLYILGALSDWQLKNEFKMTFNPKRMGFEATIFLKQGYYNYEYIYLKDGQHVGDETYIEGMHYETENDYTIYVYHHAPGTSYDQLIGIRQLNSSVTGGK
jgi:hypothetical protein